MIHKVLEKMIAYNAPDVARINHAIKVHSFARYIGEKEGCDEQTMAVLECAAILHDIGIHEAEKKYGSSAGRYQEAEGPGIAKQLLADIDIDDEKLRRILFLIGNHHSYQNIDGIDFQILVEADFLVNIYEDGFNPEAVKNVKTKIFQTPAGTRLLSLLYEKGM
ncbi:MAG: HD domain-containing protein [Spirochaetia bacterium]